MDPKKVKRFLTTLLKELLILVALGNLIALFIVPFQDWMIPKTIINNGIFSIGIGYPAMKGLSLVSSVLDRKLPWLKYPVRRLIFQIITMFLFSSLIMFAGYALLIRLLYNTTVIDSYEVILPSLKIVYSFMFLSLLLGNTVLFFMNWKKATLQQEELKRAHLTLQNQALRNQLQPHFLFNSLSSLQNLIQSDPAGAEAFVNRLSDIYRYVLEVRDSELVQLNEEERFLRDYLYLQQIRFGDKLRAVIDTSELSDRLVIPLSLQLLIENAIKHNEITGEFPLEIRITATEKNRILVSNPVRRIKQPQSSTGTGLENLQERISIFSDENLQISESGGYFEVSLPTFSKSPLS